VRLSVCVCVNDLKSWVLLIEMFWMKKVSDVLSFGGSVYSLHSVMSSLSSPSSISFLSVDL
jgi:hypothetical protein